MKNKHIAITVLIILIVMINTIVPKMKNDIRTTDRYIAKTLSNDIEIIFITLDGLNRDLLIDGKYKSIDINELKDILSDSSLYIRFVNESMMELSELNENYYLDMDGLESYLNALHEKAQNSETFDDEDFEILKEVVKLKDKYSETAHFRYYPYKKNPFKRMSLPEKTRLLFEEMQELTWFNDK